MTYAASESIFVSDLCWSESPPPPKMRAKNPRFFGS